MCGVSQHGMGVVAGTDGGGKDELNECGLGRGNAQAGHAGEGDGAREEAVQDGHGSDGTCELCDEVEGEVEEADSTNEEECEGDGGVECGGGDARMAGEQEVDGQSPGEAVEACR